MLILEIRLYINLLVFFYSKIKVWDLQAALDPRAPASTLCLRTLVVCKVNSFEVISDLLVGSEKHFVT